MGPGGEPRIGDAIVGVGDIQAGSAEQLVLMSAFNGHLSPKDGLDLVGGVDITVTGIMIYFVLTLLVNVMRLAAVVLGFLACVDVLEDMAILHGVVGLGVDLAWTL